MEPNERSGLTTTSPLKMTLIYASLELVVENDASHTCESDVWAWGCMVMVVRPRLDYVMTFTHMISLRS